MSRHARNVDLNQKEIDAAFRDMDCQVVLMHTSDDSQVELFGNECYGMCGV